MAKPLKKRKGKTADNLRQKNLARLIVENRGREPLGSLMAKAGYSHSYCKNPYQLKGTENWQEIMGIYFSDEMIAEKHLELLNAEILLTRNVYYKLKDEEIFEMFNSRGYQVVDIKRFMTNCVVTYFAPDNTNRKGTLELVNKLKGTYAPEKHSIFTTGLEGLSDEDLDRALKDKDFLIKRYEQYGKNQSSQSVGPMEPEPKRPKTAAKRAKRPKATVSRQNPVQEELQADRQPGRTRETNLQR